MTKFGLFLLLLFSSLIVKADLALDGSRIVLNHSDREASFNIKNVGKYPVVVQTWVDDGNPENTPETITDVSALSLPPIVKLGTSESQMIRILNKFTNSDQDKESLYWLNLYEITPKPQDKKNDQNVISVVVRLQVKIFYRPDNLKMDISKISESLIFKKLGNELTIENPTPFYVTIKSATTEHNPTIEIPMIEPFSKQQVKLKDNRINKINFELIKDDGDVFKGESTIQ